MYLFSTEEQQVRYPRVGGPSGPDRESGYGTVPISRESEASPQPIMRTAATGRTGCACGGGCPRCSSGTEENAGPATGKLPFSVDDQEAMLPVTGNGNGLAAAAGAAAGAIAGAAGGLAAGAAGAVGGALAGVAADAAAGALVGAAAAALSPPKLSKRTDSGPTASDCGGFSWVVQWQLDKVSPLGGWVVQKVELPNDVKDCDGKKVTLPAGDSLNPGWYPVWEAWPINKGQKVTKYAEKGDYEDDTYSAGSPGPSTKGNVKVKGTAEFYEGLTLPSSFKVTNKAPTWILPATKTDPKLIGGSGAISHDLKATWDCCGADKKTTLDTV